MFQDPTTTPQRRSLPYCVRRRRGEKNGCTGSGRTGHISKIGARGAWKQPVHVLVTVSCPSGEQVVVGRTARRPVPVPRRQKRHRNGFLSVADFPVVWSRGLPYVRRARNGFFHES